MTASDDSSTRRRLVLHPKGLALLWVMWTTIGLAMGLQDLAVSRVAFGGSSTWWRPILAEVLCYQLWWLLTPLVLRVGERWPLEHGGWRRGGVAHGLASMLIPVAYLALCHMCVLSWAREMRPPTAGREWFLSIVGNIHLEFVTYWSIVAVQHGIRLHEERRHRELSLAHAESRRIEAELRALKMQLEPHFLFNTLNGISSLIHDDPDTAEEMVVRLGDFLRLTLESSPGHVVPLRDELVFLDHYLAIETARFQDRLVVRRRFEAHVLDALVPTLCLQPIVENAVRHGISRQPAGGCIDISASRDGDGMVHIVVANTGPEVPLPIRPGVGLSNTRTRLAQMFGDAARFHMGPATGGGIVVELVVPYRRQPADGEEQPS
jgi:signal transduction histidine kinase